VILKLIVRETHVQPNPNGSAAMSQRKSVTLHQAKTHLPRLLDEVDNGVEVIIVRAGKPLVKLVPLVRAAVRQVRERQVRRSPYAPITVPAGASFRDMVALKGKSDIGDAINKKIIDSLANANKLSDMPDFNDANKLGSGKEMVDRLTNLIAIFENRALDFSKNRAEGDDILGDAYEYLMRHFATESGKSKGQF